jgi:hypothetical protein
VATIADSITIEEWHADDADFTLILADRTVYRENQRRISVICVPFLLSG